MQLEAVEAACRDEPATWKQALAAAEEALTAKDDMVHQLEETVRGPPPPRDQGPTCKVHRQS